EDCGLPGHKSKDSYKCSLYVSSSYIHTYTHFKIFQYNKGKEKNSVLKRPVTVKVMIGPKYANHTAKRTIKVQGPKNVVITRQH
ncbi:hypothetical protein BCV72DRAFT_316425, partial [Rhizopus microsporus var. microsporus]